MNLQEQLQLSDEQYQLLFDVRRSVRYHDRRRGFYERLHHVTSVMTILMAGSVLFDLGKEGETASWLYLLSVVAALLAAADMVIGYAKRASQHETLRGRFSDLEIEMVSGSATVDTWPDYQKQRLLIEKDEPPIYKVLDLLCHNDMLEAEGFKRSKTPEHFFESTWLQRWTCQLLRWNDVELSH